MTMDLERQPKHFTQLDGRKPALKAMGLFINASRLYPASAASQATLLAEYCRSQGIRPKVLKTALLSDEPALEAIRIKAQDTHRRYGRGPRDIDPERSRGIVSTTFFWAEEEMILQPDVLHFIREDLYPYSKEHRDEDGDFDETRLRRGVNLFI